MRLSRLFRDIADDFFDLALLCYRIANWFEDEMGWTWMHNRFDDLYDFFKWINYDLRDAAREIEDWWDEISDLGYDLNDLWDYAHYWLRDKVDDAYDWAVTAYNWAAEALARATEALTEIPTWVLTKLADAYDAALAIAGVIGTTFSQIVQFIEDHATIIYQYITENIYNTYNTFKEYIYNTYNTIKEYIYNTYNTIKEYITNVYQTFTEIFNTYVTNIIGVAEDWVRDFVAAALAPFAAPINLVNYWFDAIQDFFNDPLGWLWVRFTDWFLGPEK